MVSEYRYPRALRLADSSTWMTINEMSSICGVNQRQIYRWIDREFVERRVIEGRVHVKAMPYIGNDSPKQSSRRGRRYTDEQLEEFYTEVVEGKRDVKIDIGLEIRRGALPDTFRQILSALDDYKELVQYVLDR